ncbi:MAG: T9SS type A sorting domain-containing protein [Flavobacteriaceae bacterium]|nr:T9SS type A sorting domain-containing protein [Flavobacteriaceae bacterium]
MRILYFLFLMFLVGNLSYGQGSTSIVISQVYGGGGTTGATYTHDFVELFNKSGSSVDITGWSIQYNTSISTTTTWSKLNLPSVVIQKGQYFLIQLAQGSGGTTALPIPDAIGTIAMGVNAGKVVLVNHTNAIAIQCPDTGVIDLVGYGSTNCFEGSGYTASPSNTTSVMRINNGMTDTDNNDDDFVTTTPNPRNTAITLSIGKNEISNFSLYPNPVNGGKIFISTNNNFAERTVQIFDVLGKQVVNQQGTQNSIEVSHLTKGIYIIRIEEEGKTATRKLVID